MDLRLDAEIALPQEIAREAAAAAAALTRLTPHPAGLPAWQHYHAAFIERYGPGAVVPLAEVISPDTGLGFPATYRGSAAKLPAPSLSARDERLIALAYETALDGGDEITLDDAMISGLAAGDGAITQVPPHAELFAQIHAPSPAAVERGEFLLVVTGASRAAGTTAGRFLDLLDPADQDRMSRVYAGLPTLWAGALAAQVSCPPVYTRSEGVARAPAVLPKVISVAEHRGPDSSVIPLDDLAVSGDADGLYLVSLAEQRPVEPTVLNAVEFRNFSHPLARFLCEITRARAAVYMPFSWGAASSLPFLPRIRHGRSVLATARWNLAASGLPGTDASWNQWKAGAAAWRQRFGVPAAVYLGEADNLLRLDLDQDSLTLCAVTAASLADIAAAFTGRTAAGMRWLTGHIPKDSGTARPSRLVHAEAMRLADPGDHHAALRAMPGGEQIVTAWRQRASVLADYRDVLCATEEVPADSVLASLLHMHHIRAAGIDPETEQLCHRLARSAALGWVTRTEGARQ